MVDLNTKPLSPSEVLYYDWCPRSHFLHFVRNFDSRRPWLKDTKEGHKRAFLHVLYQRMLSDAGTALHTENYSQLRLEEKLGLHGEMLEAIKKYDESKTRAGVLPVEVIDVEKEFVTPDMITRTDTVIELVSDGKRYVSFGELKCFSEDERLTENYDRAKLQMRVAYQATKNQGALFGGARKDNYHSALLTVIRSEDLRISDEWVNMEEDEERTIRIMRKTRANRFKTLEGVLKNEQNCEKCSFNGACQKI